MTYFVCVCVCVWENVAYMRKGTHSHTEWPSLWRWLLFQWPFHNMRYVTHSCHFETNSTETARRRLSSEGQQQVMTCVYCLGGVDLQRLAYAKNQVLFRWSCNLFHKEVQVLLVGWVPLLSVNTDRSVSRLSSSRFVDTGGAERWSLAGLPLVPMLLCMRALLSLLCSKTLPWYSIELQIK